jgi:hypothetical protein
MHLSFLLLWPPIASLTLWPSVSRVTHPSFCPPTYPSVCAPSHLSSCKASAGCRLIPAFFSFCVSLGPSLAKPTVPCA